MTSKERTYRALEWKQPDRIPVYYFNGNIAKGDIVCFDVQRSAKFADQDKNLSEWGYRWQKIDGTMGQPEDSVIKDYAQLDGYKPPCAEDEGHFDGLEAFVEKYRDKFIMVAPDITGFTIVTFVRGFEDTLADLYLEREQLMKIVDMVFRYEIGLIEKACSVKEVDAFAFHDDWGSQCSTLISKDLFREVFLPYYKEQFALLHKAGKKVFFHSCGYVYDFIEDLIEAGVDVFNFNQPEVMGLEKIHEFQGKVTFCCPVDLQKVAITAGREQIYDYTKKMVENLGTKDGGFVGYLEEYASIGLSRQNYEYCEQALETVGAERYGK